MVTFGACKSISGSLNTVEAWVKEMATSNGEVWLCAVLTSNGYGMVNYGSCMSILVSRGYLLIRLIIMGQPAIFDRLADPIKR